jgi:uncharacterized linocin/CFP29 family protein
MNHLLRPLAPISDAGWTMLDDEARERLVPALAARKVVDFSGPHGWEYSATNLGRTTSLGPAPCPGVMGAQRRVLPVVELRASFTVALAELRAADRGAEDADLEELDRAAHQLAVAENKIVFHGWEPASIRGIAELSPHEPIPLGQNADDYPRRVAAAVERLLHNGVEGPYALALGGEQYKRVAETAEHGGYPLLDHLRKILQGPIVWAPGVAGAVVLSTRGGDFLLECGQDLAIGYESHDGEVVRLYLEESVSFRVATPEAAFTLTVDGGQ